ncbi:DMT family transporter [Roseovarius indicus]|uniref:Carboxylate/amino acid/amine transporter n=1 Tax=Roseovarius indicus TaxID=540747 RepID=A0A0T5P384_9RHOB|nr:DMT family transporter [Roseovarius indicus]KRS15611.1 membrane protein [Roseovarius indicus]QEW27885.1 carboxylate/amino acid/amine transporter [Roseovarius indicus]SFE78047.1 Permease of the drug/metabolite transporter (DMT) superfamily [Roseovarius indicus]
MATYTPDTCHAPSRTAHGIACVLLGMVLFVGQDAFMKTLLQTYPIWMLMFVRSSVAVLVLVPLILLLGGPHRLTSPLWRLHLLRAALFAVGFALFYTAFPFMGLAEVTTIFFSAPLMIAAMAAVFLKETIGIHRIGALVTGFAGVLIAMNPGSDSFTWVSILPLLCAVFYAGSQILARQIGERESSLTVGLYTLAFTGPILLAMGYLMNATIGFGPEFHHLRWAFPAETGADLPVLLMLGLVGMAAYILLSRGYQVADASIIAPFDYSYLPIAALMAFVVWGEVPALTTIVGMALIAASGLYIGYRELRAARKGNDPVYVAETVTAPGSTPPQKVPDDQTWP